MHHKYWKTLEASGLPPDIIEKLKNSPRINDVDRMFCNGALNALALAGCRPLEFLAIHPGCSILELARRLNRNCNAAGLIMAILEQAAADGRVRETAKDLLLREIWSQFPSGWQRDKADEIWSWVRLLEKHVEGSADDCYAERIARSLVSESPPLNGWKPEPYDDPVIDALFDRYWPDLEQG